MSSHKVIKTIAEINERIKKGRAVVLNAEEMTEAVRRMGPEKAAREVDVVTTGTFSPMCSPGLLFNIGQPEPPKIRTTRVWMNDVPAYAGLAAVDAYLGATELPEDDPQNKAASICGRPHTGRTATPAGPSTVPSRWRIWPAHSF